MNPNYNQYKEELEKLKENSSYRSFKTIEKRDGKYVYIDGTKYLNLSSNDYLGLLSDKELINEFYSDFHNNIENFQPGSTSSRLLTGNYKLYNQLEDELARIYSSEAALFVNSGYHANIGILPALTSKGDLILSDKLNHASVIDGLKLSDAEYIRYKHLDYNHLEDILEKKRDKYNRVFIVSESIFSMDGDIADLNRLVDIKNKYNTFLYIDEAHAVGVKGENGLGECEAQNVVTDIDIIVGTFGKALASQGAFVITSSIIKEYLVNKMRSLIFTTALPPVVIAWNLFVIKRISSYSDKREHLNNISIKLREELLIKGLNTLGNSNIIPVIIGDNDKTIELSNKLKANGLLAFPVRPPSVPVNSSRLRISLTAELTLDDIKNIPGILSKTL